MFILRSGGSSINGTPRPGRPRSLDKKQAAMAAAILADRDGSVADICRTLGFSGRTMEAN
jgi:hypothetical protein